MGWFKPFEKNRTSLVQSLKVKISALLKSSVYVLVVTAIVLMGLNTKYDIFRWVVSNSDRGKERESERVSALFL